MSLEITGMLPVSWISLWLDVIKHLTRWQLLGIGVGVYLNSSMECNASDNRHLAKLAGLPAITQVTIQVYIPDRRYRSSKLKEAAKSILTSVALKKEEANLSIL